MSYKDLTDLPEAVKFALPKHALEIYLASFNHAWDEYKDPNDRRGNDSREEVSHKVAWSAVKHSYKKVGAEWHKK